MDLVWGKWLLEAISRLPAGEGFTVVLRHSERPDFKNIPVQDWNKVLLTKKGEEAAIDFGKSIASRSDFKSLNTAGWGLERCQETARKIAEGFSFTGMHDGDYSRVDDFPSPIANLSRYNEMLRSGMYYTMIENWLTDPSENTVMLDYSKFTEEVMDRLLKSHGPENGKRTVIATHDLHIMPLIRTIFGKKVTDIDFLDGIMITSYDGMLKAHYKEGTVELTHYF